MKFSYINKINFKKLKKYKGKSLFLIIPITLLVMLGIVISSQASNILKASQDTIFGTAAESGRLIELSTTQVTQSTNGNGDNQRVRFAFGGDTQYSDSDVDKISQIKHVENAALTVSLPISLITTNDLFSDTDLSLNNLRTLPSELSAQYTDQNFTYTEGEPIPIILNANSFVKNYEEWNGQDEITISISGSRTREPGSDRSAIESQSPFKFEALSYDKNDLVGKTITISFGGFDPIQTYEQEFTSDGILFRQLAADQITENENARKDILSPYWNYGQLNTPLTYTFKIVGVLESEGSFASFVPESFGSELMHDYFQKQLDTRTDTEIPTDSLNATFFGTTYDGLQLQSSDFGGLGGFRVERGGGPFGVSVGSASDASGETSYTIPGLVITTERETGNTNAFEQRAFGSTGTATGVSTNPNVFDEATQQSDTILIKIDNIANRSQVVEDLNSAGCAYQDLNDQKVFTELQSTMNSTTTIATISFIVLTAIIIILTMGKFVSESRKEIGVFRAIGATKGEIKQLFMSQAMLYALIGYILGSVVGIILVLLIAKPVQLWFNSFIEKTVGETFAVVQQTSAGTFTHIDWTMFGIYTVLLILIAVLVSIIPATRASRISPIEAIKNE